MFDDNDPFNNIDPFKEDIGVCPLCGIPLDAIYSIGGFCIACAQDELCGENDYPNELYETPPKKIPPPQEKAPERNTENVNYLPVYILLGVICLAVLIICIMYDT